ncbi:MAG: hypothetical protein M1365_05535 [Actinobacteria bacterium]|nr:hypothetical protein [Actinomycetota bacterium]
MQINISAKAGNYIDADNFLGTINKNKSKEDLSAFEPPALENNISLYFNSNGNKYSSLFQDANSATKIWEFEVKTGIKKEDVTISWDNVLLPGDEIAVLVDVQNNTTVDMTDTDKYVYNSGQGGTRKFIVKEGSYLDIAKSLNLQISRVLVLPNPVKQTTSGKDKAKLLIDVSSGYPVETEVQLFNTSGQTIKTFVSSPIMLAKGKFKFSSPDFENVADALPNGVYLLKVTLSNDSNKVSKVLKMAVVK